MVSHFGEVIFPSSRAFWDDEDEYEPNDTLQHHSKLSVNWLKNKPEIIERLIIMEGDLLIPFAEQCLCHEAEQMCIVENENHKKVSIIYKMDKHIYLCAILPSFNIKDAGTFINEISDLLLKTNSTVSIVCRHVSEFQGTNVPDGSSILRILASKHTYLSESEIEQLEQPNIIHGVGAGVLSYSEFMGLSAKLYVLYIDSFILDSTCTEPILKILRKETNCKLQNVKFSASFFSKGNLYM